MTAPILLAFLAGAAYEALAVAWVTATYARSPLRTGMVSMVQGVMLVNGLAEGFTVPAARWAYALGLGAGAFGMVWWDARRTA